MWPPSSAAGLGYVKHINAISTLGDIYEEGQILSEYHQNVVVLSQLVTDSDHRLRILIWV